MVKVRALPPGDCISATIVEESLVRMRMATEMATLATTVPLTGIANRTLFRKRTAAALEQRRSGAHVAVLFCDLDDFKPVNDRFGHEGGDTVLLTMAKRLSRCVREGDTVARLGGDEFALLLEDIASDRDALSVAERTITSLSSHGVVNLGPLEIEPEETSGTLLVQQEDPLTPPELLSLDVSGTQTIGAPRRLRANSAATSLSIVSTR